MELAVHTASLYISAFLSVQTSVTERSCTDFRLPSPFTSDKEEDIIRQLFHTMQEQAICYLYDRAMMQYCLVFAGETILVIGPYRTGSIKKSDLPPQLFSEDHTWSQYQTYYNTLPCISPEKIKLAAQILLTSLYGDSFTCQEHEVNIREYLKGDIPILESGVLSDELRGIQHMRKDNAFSYITQVRTGNYQNALAAYQDAMRGRGTSFSLIRTVEGLSTLRNLTRIALNLAGVPETSADAMFADFKAKGRTVASVEEAKLLCSHLIEQSCDLVRRFRSEHYSDTIQSAIDFIHTNLSRPITVAEISQHVGLSPNRFSTNFHKETGMTVTAYILRLRMESAAQLLVYTNLNIQHICTNIGILDNNYFTRCFKNTYGVTPSEFRRKGALPESP